MAKSPNCPKETRHESSLPSGQTGSMAKVRQVTNAAKPQKPNR